MTRVGDPVRCTFEGCEWASGAPIHFHPEEIMTQPDEHPQVIPAYLGWGNPERDNVHMRLYATDEGSGDRWDRRYTGGRVVEYAATERAGTEGDRYLVVRAGNRFLSDEEFERIAAACQAAVDAARNSGSGS